MEYLDSFYRLRECLKSDEPLIHFDDLAIYKQEFNSYSHELLPGKEMYYCNPHNQYFEAEDTFNNHVGSIDDMIHVRDIDVKENRIFSYRIFMPKSMKQAKRAIFLMHGFNEKNWDKYLPWAQYLTEQTQSAVILFPIAFHMNRTLMTWSDKRKMFQLSEKRKKMFPDVVNSSLSNVAISMRLHSSPQRFIWSGLQTYYDVIQFVERCKSGDNPLIAPSADFHFVSYSIGCLLSEILKLTNPNNYFSDSKLCFFCGGAVFNRLSPVSKYILDSEANIALYSFLIEHIEKHMAKDAHLKHYISGTHQEGQIFYSMLDYKIKREYREELFNQVSQDIFAISLKQDSIIPPYEIVNTLQGASRDIPIPVEIYDFPFPYSHESPFPVTKTDKDIIDEKFKMVFDKISTFIKK